MSTPAHSYPAVKAGNPIVGFNVVALVVAALDKGPDTCSLYTISKTMSHGRGRAEPETTATRHAPRTPSSDIRVTSGINITQSTISYPPRHRRRRKDTPPPPTPRHIAFSSSSCSTTQSRNFVVVNEPSDDSACDQSTFRLPDAVVEVVMDFLPAAQALSMVARSRAADRGMRCSRYALSRLDKVVTGLAVAEDAYHNARCESHRKNDKDKEDREDRMKTNRNEAEGEVAAGADAARGCASSERPREARFYQLGDLASLDIIYKTSLNVARMHHVDPMSGEDSKILGAGNQRGGGDVHGGNGISRVDDRSGQPPFDNRLHDDGPVWVRSGCEAARAWGVGHRLMGLLATGMVSNLAKRVSEHRGTRNIEVGIVTDCMHPTTAGNRCFRFRDSLDMCGLLGLNRFPLLVITGVCILHTKSPIFACLPGVDGCPIQLTSASFDTGYDTGYDSTDKSKCRDKDDVRAGVDAGGSSGTSECLGADWVKSYVLYDGDVVHSGKASPGGTARICETYRSQCGRYTAALIRLHAPEYTTEEGHQEVGRSALERSEITRLSYGVGSCRSKFCRSWGVPSYTLVVFSEAQLLRDPVVFRGSDGKWTFSDGRSGDLVHMEWASLLGLW